MIAFLLSLILNCISFNVIKKKLKHPLRNHKFAKIKKMNISTLIQSICGSILMGVAWGIGNVLPSSMVSNFQFITPHLIFFYFPAFLLGQIIGQLLKNLIDLISKPKPPESNIN
jgi:hypothetical protein